MRVLDPAIHDHLLESRGNSAAHGHVHIAHLTTHFEQANAAEETRLPNARHGPQILNNERVDRVRARHAAAEGDGIDIAGDLEFQQRQTVRRNLAAMRQAIAQTGLDRLDLNDGTRERTVELEVKGGRVRARRSAGGRCRWSESKVVLRQAAFAHPHHDLVAIRIDEFRSAAIGSCAKDVRLTEDNIGGAGARAVVVGVGADDDIGEAVAVEVAPAVRAEAGEFPRHAAADDEAVRAVDRREAQVRSEAARLAIDDIDRAGRVGRAEG